MIWLTVEKACVPLECGGKFLCSYRSWKYDWTRWTAPLPNSVTLGCFLCSEFRGMKKDKFHFKLASENPGKLLDKRNNWVASLNEGCYSLSMKWALYQQCPLWGFGNTGKIVKQKQVKNVKEEAESKRHFFKQTNKTRTMLPKALAGFCVLLFCFVFNLSSPSEACNVTWFFFSMEFFLFLSHDCS